MLGNKKEIPCSTENMSNAYKNLLKNPTAIKHPNGYYNINRTHLYVKFQPQDSIQYNKIINDTILAVSDEPFEYEVISEGSVYLDPRTIDSTFTAYYSVVPINYTIPTNVPYTIIDNLHFTKEDEIRDSPSTTEEQILDFYEDLNTEALKISDNLEEDEKFEHTYFLNDPSEKLTYDDLKRLGLKVKDVQINYELEPNELDNIQESRLFGRRRKWNPCGRITVREDVLNQNIGVAGARVKVRKWGWLVIRKAYTNNNGDFQTSSTRTKRVKYAVYFRNSDKRFKVKAGTIFWDARHRGHRKYKRKCWYQDFNNTGVRSHFYALVHNAAYDYYSRAVNTFGLKKPNQSWLRISAKFNNTIGQSNHLDINPNGQIPFIPLLSFYSEIRVGRKSQGTYAGSDRIYGTVVHEMTHASHYRLDRNFFANWPSCERIGPMAESWAEGAETILTNDRYNQLSNNYVSTQAQNNANLFNAGLTNHNDRLQTLTIADIDEYTPIVVDLIDNLNQNTPGFWSGVQPIDNVSGYTLSQIQSALNISRGIDGWKKRIMNINGNDDAAINELFNQYMYNICD